MRPVADGEITVVARMIAAGIDEDSAMRWLSSGGVRIDGEVVNDPGTSAGPPRRIVLLPT